MKATGQSYLHGAVIYTIGIVVVKLIGAFYKIPLGNILGDDGYNHFMVSYKIYNVFLTISTAGIPVAMSRLISEANALGHIQRERQIFCVSLRVLFVIGSIGSATMLLLPTELARTMGDEWASDGIFVMAPSVLFVCVMAAYRGYAQGHADMVPTTLSQIIETGIKVVVGLAIVFALDRLGKGLEVCAAGAILGTTVGSFIAMLYLIKNRRDYQIEECDSPTDGGRVQPYKYVLKELLRVGWPVTISSSAMSLIQLVDSTIILNLLQKKLGYTEEVAFVLNGAYEKAVAIYNLPYAFVVPFMASVVPSIASARMNKSDEDVCVIAEDIMRMSTIICLPMAVGMTVLAEPCMSVLFPTVAKQGDILLKELGMVSYFMSVSLITNSILSANGNERLPLISVLLGGVTKVVVTYILVGRADINIYGAPVGTFCCYIVMLAANLFFISRKMCRRVRLWKIFGKASVCAGLMGLFVHAIWMFLDRRVGVLKGAFANRPLRELITFAVPVVVGMAVYCFLVIIFRVITVEDMKMLPKGEYIARKLHIY